MVPLGDRLPATTGLPTLSPIFDGGFWSKAWVDKDASWR
jgi:hypothetical protein